MQHTCPNVKEVVGQLLWRFGQRGRQTRHRHCARGHCRGGAAPVGRDGVLLALAAAPSDRQPAVFDDLKELRVVHGSTQSRNNENI